MSLFPFSILLCTALLMYLHERRPFAALLPWMPAAFGLLAAFVAILVTGQGGVTEYRYLLDHFSMTIIACALAGTMAALALQPRVRTTIAAADLLALAGLALAAGAQDILLTFAGLSVTILALVRPRPHARAFRQLSPPYVALALIAAGLSLIIALSGATGIVDVRMSLGILQVNNRGDIGLILIPALLCLLSGWFMLLLPPGLDHWLHGTTRLRHATDALVLLLWPLLVVVGVARFFVGMLFAYVDPVMSPNDWGLFLTILLALATIVIALRARRANHADQLLLCSWQLQLVALPVGLLTITSDGLASSLGLAVIATFNAALIGALPRQARHAYSWPLLLLCAAMIGFPGAAGFAVRLASLDAAASINSLQQFLPLLVAVHFAAVALMCTILVRRGFALTQNGRDPFLPETGGWLAGRGALIAVGTLLILSSLSVSPLLAALTPVGSLFGLTAR